MIVAIHQPNFLPWTGYFYKIAACNTFVLLDDVQFTKNSYINRNRIKTQAGEQWLTVPVVQSGNFGQKINETTIFNPEISYKKLVASIKTNYGKATYFKEIFDFLQPCFCNQLSISVMNEMLIRAISNYLEIGTKIVKSSELGPADEVSTQRLIEICTSLGAETYLAGFGSSNYQDNGLFHNAGINNTVYNFLHPVYAQLWGGFIPNMSIIDFLFNEGPGSRTFFNTRL